MSVHAPHRVRACWFRVVLVSAALIAQAAVAGAPSASATHSWKFDSDQAGQPPAGFSFGRTGGGAPGRWVVRAEPDAPSGPNVLAQIDADGTDYRFPIAVADGVFLRDLRLSVLCKPVSGEVDQACGLVFRYVDESNYYVTRVNALENNVRLYGVRNGRRHQIAGFDGPVTAGVWHRFAVEARGDRLQVFWDGRKVIEKRDGTFPAVGRVGVWTKADSASYFDDLVVMSLSEAGGR